MTPAERNVAIFTANAEHFAEVRAHNHQVFLRRRKGDDWSAPENQYRSAWQELAPEDFPPFQGVGRVGA